MERLKKNKENILHSHIFYFQYEVNSTGKCMLHVSYSKHNHRSACSQSCLFKSKFWSSSPCFPLGVLSSMITQKTCFIIAGNNFNNEHTVFNELLSSRVVWGFFPLTFQSLIRILFSFLFFKTVGVSGICLTLSSDGLG